MKVFIIGSESSELNPVKSYEFGQDYTKTLSIWPYNFDNVYEQIKNMGFDDLFVKLWRFYLAGCAAAFKSGYINVRQVEILHAQ